MTKAAEDCNKMLIDFTPNELLIMLYCDNKFINTCSSLNKSFIISKFEKKMHQEIIEKISNTSLNIASFVEKILLKGQAELCSAEHR